jgi:hypothetical protein
MDPEGFTEFVASRGQALFRMALALTADRASAEDLVQEALTRTVSRWRKIVRNGDPDGIRPRGHAQPGANSGSAARSKARGDRGGVAGAGGLP